MLILRLLQESCPEKIPVTILDRLGDGADGEVFTFAEDSNKVIKLSLLFDFEQECLDKKFKYTSKVFNHLIKHPSSVFVQIYEHKYLCQWATECADKSGWRKYICYYSIMEKLYKISEDEKKVFHSILSHEDRGIKKNFSDTKIKEMLYGLGRGLDFDAERITFFISNLKNAPVEHLDIHVRNIMKDVAGNFKMIDFDRAELKYGDK